MKKPYISFVRQSLKLKGRSEHNGRGGYECEFNNCTAAELMERLAERIPQWKDAGLIEEVVETGHSIQVTFKQTEHNEYYRGFLFVSESLINYGVYFCQFRA